MLIFLPYMKLYSKCHKYFTDIYQNKTKLHGENRKCLVYLLEVASYINYIQAIWLSGVV